MNRESTDTVYTFGMGHRDPDTGESLAGKCVIITDRTTDPATRPDPRVLMCALYGAAWSMEYDGWERATAKQALTVHARYELTDLRHAGQIFAAFSRLDPTSATP